MLCLARALSRRVLCQSLNSWSSPMIKKLSKRSSRFAAILYTGFYENVIQFFLFRACEGAPRFLLVFSVSSQVTRRHPNLSSLSELESMVWIKLESRFFSRWAQSRSPSMLCCPLRTWDLQELAADLKQELAEKLMDLDVGQFSMYPTKVRSHIYESIQFYILRHVFIFTSEHPNLFSLTLLRSDVDSAHMHSSAQKCQQERITSWN